MRTPGCDPGVAPAPGGDEAAAPATRRPRVLLVSMPFGALERPSLGLGLLGAVLARQGVRCDTRYLGFTFAEFTGVDDYLWVAGTLPHTAFAGDWAFTRSLYGERPGASGGSTTKPSAACSGFAPTASRSSTTACAASHGNDTTWSDSRPRSSRTSPRWRWPAG